MKILVDMNLSPEWVKVFTDKGIAAVHWSTIGAVNATDKDLMTWAKNCGYIVLTHDLDFGSILAATKADSPSVIQLRFQNISPEKSKELVLHLITLYSSELDSGVLISIDMDRARLRILPLAK